MTGTPTLTTAALSDFLDRCLNEESSRNVHEFDCDRFQVYDYGCRQGNCDCRADERLRADVDAKRAIIDRLALHARAGDGACVRAARDVLTLMARPYGEDPEYRWTEGNPFAATGTTSTIIYGPGDSILEHAARVGYLPGDSAVHARAVVEDLAAVPGGRWELRSPAGQPAPTRQQAIVWEYFYPDGNPRVTTGYQVQWQAGGF